MNETIIKNICLELNIKEYQVKNTLNLSKSKKKSKEGRAISKNLLPTKLIQ